MHARAKMLRGQQAVYYVPYEAIAPLTAALTAFNELDGAIIDMKIKAVAPGSLLLNIFRV